MAGNTESTHLEILIRNGGTQIEKHCSRPSLPIAAWTGINPSNRRAVLCVYSRCPINTQQQLEALIYASFGPQPLVPTWGPHPGLAERWPSPGWAARQVEAPCLHPALQNPLGQLVLLAPGAWLCGRYPKGGNCVPCWGQQAHPEPLSSGPAGTAASFTLCPHPWCPTHPTHPDGPGTP